MTAQGSPCRRDSISWSGFPVRSDEWQWPLADADQGAVQLPPVQGGQGARHGTARQIRVRRRNGGHVPMGVHYFRPNDAVAGGVRGPQRPGRVDRTGLPDLGGSRPDSAPRLVQPSSSTAWAESQRIRAAV